MDTLKPIQTPNQKLSRVTVYGDSFWLLLSPFIFDMLQAYQVGIIKIRELGQLTMDRENKEKQKSSLKSYLQLFILLKCVSIYKSRSGGGWWELKQSFFPQPFPWKGAWEPLSTLDHLCLTGKEAAEAALEKGNENAECHQW